MKQKRNLQSIWRQIKFYRPKDYETFRALCRNEGSTVTRELNRFVIQTAKTGKLEGSHYENS